MENDPPKITSPILSNPPSETPAAPAVQRANVPPPSAASSVAEPHASQNAPITYNPASFVSSKTADSGIQSPTGASGPASQNAPGMIPLGAQLSIAEQIGKFAGGAFQMPRTIDRLKAEAEKEPEITPLRTYQGDVEMYLKSQNGSLTKIAVAEEAKRETTRAPIELPQKTSSSRFFVMASLTLIALSGGIIGVFLLLQKEEPQPQPKFTFAPTISTDLQKEFNISGTNKASIFSALISERDKTQIALGSVLTIYFTEGGGEEKRLVTPNVFFQAINTALPAELSRALSGNLTFGLHSSNGNQPFLVLKVTEYQNGFAGMLAWESTLRDDLGEIFIQKTPLKENGSATSTPPLEPTDQFIDVVVKNRDIRALKSGNETLLLYAFPDPTTIIITTNDRTLDEITRRLIQSRIVR